MPCSIVADHGIETPSAFEPDTLSSKDTVDVQWPAEPDRGTPRGRRQNPSHFIALARIQGVILKGELLEVRNVDGRLHIARKEHTWTPVEAMTHYRPGDEFIDD